MKESETVSQSKLALQRFGKIRQVARLFLQGPGALMYPDDPKGIKSWLEPVVCLKAHSLSPRASKSLSVYAVPNCLARKRTDAILVRNANWESGKDKSLCQKGSPNLPTITTIYTKVMGEKIALVHQLLLKVDQTLTNFSYPVEGLDLSGSSGFKPLPENAVIVSQGADYEFSRTSRFCYMELHWTPSQHHLEDFDQAWLALFDSLLKITERSSSEPQVQIVEKYDVDPSEFSKVLIGLPGFPPAR